MESSSKRSRKSTNHFKSGRFLSAVQDNDLSAVRTAVARRRAEGHWDPRHWTVTMALILAPSSEITTYLKYQGATVTSQCLPSAVQQGSSGLLNVLITCLKKKVIWDPEDWYVVWALVEACCAPNPDVRQALERHGASLTTKCLPLIVRNMVLSCLRLVVTELKASERWDPVDRYVSLALMETQRLHNKNMYVYLINQGARPTTQCLLVAVRTSNTELLKDIIHYTKIYRKWRSHDKFVAWAMEEACLVPDENMYEILVSEGAVPDSQCLLSTVRSGHIGLATRVVCDMKAYGTWRTADWRLESAKDKAKSLSNSEQWLQVLQGDVAPSYINSKPRHTSTLLTEEDNDVMLKHETRTSRSAPPGREINTGLPSSVMKPASPTASSNAADTNRQKEANDVRIGDEHVCCSPAKPTLSTHTASREKIFSTFKNSTSCDTTVGQNDWKTTSYLPYMPGVYCSSGSWVSQGVGKKARALHVQFNVEDTASSQPDESNESMPAHKTADELHDCILTSQDIQQSQQNKYMYVRTAEGSGARATIVKSRVRNDNPVPLSTRQQDDDRQYTCGNMVYTAEGNIEKRYTSYHGFMSELTLGHSDKGDQDYPTSSDPDQLTSFLHEDNDKSLRELERALLASRLQMGTTGYPLTSTPRASLQKSRLAARQPVDDGGSVPGVTELRQLFSRAIAEKQIRDTSRAYHEAELALAEIRSSGYNVCMSTAGGKDSSDEEGETTLTEIQRIFNTALDAKHRDVRASWEDTDNLLREVRGLDGGITSFKSSAMFGGRYKPFCKEKKSRSIPADIIRPTHSADIKLPVLGSRRLACAKLDAISLGSDVTLLRQSPVSDVTFLRQSPVSDATLPRQSSTSDATLLRQHQDSLGHTRQHSVNQLEIGQHLDTATERKVTDISARMYYQTRRVMTVARLRCISRACLYRLSSWKRC